MSAIKKVNWPWVEVEDRYSPEGTILINIDEASVIWDRPTGQYHYGVKLKRSGDWIEHISKEGLKELKELVMKKDKEE